MAMDKMWREAFERLDRIEKTLNALAGQPQASAKNGEPWDGYGAATVAEINDRLPQLDDAQRAQVLAFEQSHKNRAGVVQPLVNWNS